jgi:hypothetical protein
MRVSDNKCIQTGSHKVHSDIHGYDAIPKGVKNYMYGMKTGSANLRKHLITHHESVYMQMAEKEGWKYVGKVKKPTIGENRKMALPSFSPESFLEYLVRFVAADDQVSPNP